MRTRTTTGGNVTETRAALPAAEAFSLLSEDRRWAVAAAVGEADHPLSTGEMSVMLAAREQRVPPERVDGGTRESIQRDLESVHIPQLDSCDVIEREGGDQYAPGRNLEGLLEAAEAASHFLGDVQGLREN
jgi:hypothetical protein